MSETLMWIKRKGDDRFHHAVYTPAPGGYWTNCEQFVGMKAVDELVSEVDGDENSLVSRRCSRCQSRIGRPHLFPHRLQNIKADYEAGKRGAA